MFRGFDFYVGGIEDGIIAALQPLLSEGVKTIASYGGEMDAENLRRALSQLTARMPLLLVAYGDGRDVEHPATAPVPPTISRFFKHECTFTVICCSNDARGETARRRGVYGMIEDVWATVAGLQFKVNIQDPPESVLLNPEPMKPAGVEYLARLPELTAYAVHFDTYFRWQTPDRSLQGPLVQELVIDIENTYPKGEAHRPGVVLE